MFDSMDCITDYFQAVNQQDTDTAVACFTPNAFVRDEGREHHGSPAIREWIKNTTQQYQATTAITDSALRGDEIVVTALVSGTFPGSPLSLTFRFRVEAKKIAALTIEG